MLLTDKDRAIIRYALQRYSILNAEFAAAASQEHVTKPGGGRWSVAAIHGAIEDGKRAAELMELFK